MQVLKNKYFIGFMVLIILLAFIDWIIFGRSPVKEFQNVTAVVSQGLSTVGKNHGVSAGVTMADDPVRTAAMKPVAPDFTMEQATPEEFQAWIKEESKTMLHYNVNADTLTARYQALTAKMTVVQFQILAGIVKSPNLDANQKILASYLLGYSGYASIKDLADVAGSSFKLSGEPTAHSVAEVEQTRERALRTIPIDRLATLARGENKAEALKARQQLQNLIATISDLYLKNYAQSKFNEL